MKDILTQLHLVRDGCREAEQVAVVRGRGEGWGGGGVTSGEIGELCEGVQEVKLGGGGEGPREWNEREKQLAESCVDLISIVRYFLIPRICACEIEYWGENSIVQRIRYVNVTPKD